MHPQIQKKVPGLEQLHFQSQHKQYGHLSWQKYFQDAGPHEITQIQAAVARQHLHQPSENHLHQFQHLLWPD